MFATMVLLLLTGQRVFGAIGFVAAAAALLLWGDCGKRNNLTAGFLPSFALFLGSAECQAPPNLRAHTCMPSSPIRESSFLGAR